MKEYIFKEDTNKIPRDFLYNIGTFIEHVTLPEKKPLVIEDGAFSDSYNLSEIKIPNNVTHIGSFAFNNCIKLKNVELNANIERIRSHTFCNCQSLEEIIIPEGIKTIEAYAFANCFNLKNIILPKSLEVIEFCVFKSCPSLKTIKLPKDIKIGDEIFDKFTIDTIYIDNKTLSKNIVFAALYGDKCKECPSLDDLLDEGMSMREITNFYKENKMER